MYLIIIFICLFLLELLYFTLANKYNIIDKPNERSSHTNITLRGGGIIFYWGILVYFFTNHLSYPWFTFGLTLISIISFIDDICPISQKLRLIFHFTGISLLIYQWMLMDISWAWWYSIIALILCTGIINAYNFMDGINGITGGYSLIVLLSLIYINKYIVSFTNPNLLHVITLAVLVFNFFNFRKKAKCFAGDVGSISIAFILVFLIGQLVLTTNDFSYIILLVVYGVDSVLTIIHRIILRENIGLPHRKHLYQIIANELRVPHIAVAFIYMLTQTSINIIFIINHPYGYGYGYAYLLIILVLLSAIYIIIKKKYFHLHMHETFITKQNNQKAL